ncbi:hypothetical protein C7C46_30295 [Streptomyces tateyamensis]|uniref:VWA domain-containing protein n=1 Tax=Streptomyces tateyamensis TaxID=565073 RepID=A0A2V4MTL6_9ACTN|nr:VWA domain-containing protein [Streptomyces tateyamensis]PYC67430.1 hypothetical protein C7C46_30295 [Streptomyces tateyamensis]
MTAGLTGRLTAFVQALRAHGIPVGPGETVDAAAVAELLGLAHREQLRAGLAAALLRGQQQRRVFDATFDLYFPLRVGGVSAEASRDELRERLARALAADDRAALAGLAAEAVGALGRFGNPPGSGGWSASQTLDRLRPQTLLAGLLAERQELRARQQPQFTDRLAADQFRHRIDFFRALVATEARRRAAELAGTDEIARRAVTPSVERTDFLYANHAQLAELRRTVQPLARRLATRLAARRRRAARGSIDLRRTVRRSLGTGGVPLRPAYRQRRPQRPELVLLCDVSNSVAGFSDFTALLVQALRDQFSRVRVFAFVNQLAEVTDGGLDRARMVGLHGYSDYGTALGQFADRHLAAVTPRSTVLVLGDARTNRRDPNLAALARIALRARRVYWLNPEPPSLWNTGDSAAAEYASVVPMHPCRNADQLGRFVERLLP